MPDELAVRNSTRFNEKKNAKGNVDGSQTLHAATVIGQAITVVRHANNLLFQNSCFMHNNFGIKSYEKKFSERSF